MPGTNSDYGNAPGDVESRHFKGGSPKGGTTTWSNANDTTVSNVGPRARRRVRQAGRDDARWRVFRPPEQADFHGFVVWCYTQGVFLGQEFDRRTDTITHCYVRNGAWAVQFDSYGEACERAFDIHTPTLILYAPERNGSVFITGTEQ